MATREDMTFNVEQLSKKELFHAQGRLMFGQVREDAAVDLFLVRQLQSPSRLFVIASGGCTALSLLTVDSCTVDALDISQAQIALVELKAALLSILVLLAAKQACIGDGSRLP
jgi:S-adenosylmethionine:diacylglycerol 3-amino-3-carboxypropyl transferase